MVSTDEIMSALHSAHSLISDDMAHFNISDTADPEWETRYAAFQAIGAACTIYRQIQKKESAKTATVAKLPETLAVNGVEYVRVPF